MISMDWPIWSFNQQNDPMKIALAQQNYHIGNFDSNTKKIIDAVRHARQCKVDLIVFPELAICGYPPRDFLDFDHFIKSCTRSLKEIARECKDIAAIAGTPSFNQNSKGKRLFNSAYLLYKGKIDSVCHKSLLPNYDIFDEYRYFEPNVKFELVYFKDLRIALTICEDLWNITDNPLYTVNPMDELMKQNPNVIINIAASPFHYEQDLKRKKILKANVSKYQLPLFYVNHCGAQTELIFDGGSLALDDKGRTVEEIEPFEEGMAVYSITFTRNKNKIETSLNCDRSCSINLKKPNSQASQAAMIRTALVTGIHNYFEKLNFKKAILGLSGGIDSAVTCALAVEALGKENVRGILLPSRFSSGHSIADARKLAENLGIPYDVVPIEGSFNSLEQLMDPLFKDLPEFGLAEENMQARIRAVILMAMANKLGYILLNTSNKSEAAVGYGTLYGDMCGGISVLGDVYKTQVYEIATLLNKEKEVIPQNTIDKPPSAELRPGQKDSDSLPEYELLDKILYQYIERSKGPDDIIAMGMDENTVHKVLKLVNTSEWKRYQTPPILRVSPKAFGMGRRMPIAAKYLG
jgi:NAD+ synthase (glutamine-hydrolysing)